jgi:hypothetical protein
MSWLDVVAILLGLILCGCFIEFCIAIIVYDVDEDDHDHF